VLNSLQITTQDNEVQIRADIKNEVVQQFVASLMNKKKEEGTTAAKPAPAKAKKTTKHRRGKRRARGH
jgi:hypothetical protein